MVVNASTSPPDPTQQLPSPWHPCPPGLVTVRQRDDPLCARPPEVARQQAQRCGRAEHHPAGTGQPHQGPGLVGHGGGRQEDAVATYDLVGQRGVVRCSARLGGGQHDDVVVAEPAHLLHEALDAADPGREVVRHDQGGRHAHTCRGSTAAEAATRTATTRASTTGPSSIRLVLQPCPPAVQQGLLVDPQHVVQRARHGGAVVHLGIEPDQLRS